MSVKKLFLVTLQLSLKKKLKIGDFTDMTNFIYKDANDLEERTLTSREKTFKFYSKILQLIIVLVVSNGQKENWCPCITPPATRIIK